MDEAKCAEPASHSEAVAGERAVAESTVDVLEVQAGSYWATCTSIHTCTIYTTASVVALFFGYTAVKPITVFAAVIVCVGTIFVWRGHARFFGWCLQPSRCLAVTVVRNEHTCNRLDACIHESTRYSGGCTLSHMVDGKFDSATHVYPTIRSRVRARCVSVSFPFMLQVQPICYLVRRSLLNAL